MDNYILKNTVVHKLNPVLKIISLLIMILTIFFIDSYIDLLVAGSYLLLTIAYSEIELEILKKRIINSKIIILFISIFTLILSLNINIVIYNTFKLILILTYLNILIYTTAITEIMYGISSILNPFSKYINVVNVSVAITILLKHFNIYEEEKERIENLQKELNIENKKIKDKIKNIKLIITITIKRIEEIITIMELRLTGYGKSRTNYRYNKWQNKDTFVLILNILIFIIAIFY